MNHGQFSRKKAYPGSTHNKVVDLNGPTDPALTANVDKILARMKSDYQPVIHKGVVGTTYEGPAIPMPDVELEQVA